MTLTDPGTDGLAFDLSHTDHRSAQSSHWDRALEVTHALIELLKGVEYEDAKGPPGPASGTAA